MTDFTTSDSLLFAETRDSGYGWAYDFLPYIEQDNLNSQKVVGGDETLDAGFFFRPEPDDEVLISTRVWGDPHVSEKDGGGWESGAETDDFGLVL